MCSISVTDTGTGMAAHVRERAFEPFFTTKPIGEGSGLGLSQVYGFVNQMGGHVAIESTRRPGDDDPGLSAAGAGCAGQQASRERLAAGFRRGR